MTLEDSFGKLIPIPLELVVSWEVSVRDDTREVLKAGTDT